MIWNVGDRTGLLLVLFVCGGIASEKLFKSLSSEARAGSHEISASDGLIETKGAPALTSLPSPDAATVSMTSIASAPLSTFHPLPRAIASGCRCCTGKVKGGDKSNRHSAQVSNYPAIVTQAGLEEPRDPSLVSPTHASVQEKIKLFLRYRLFARFQDFDAFTFGSTGSLVLHLVGQDLGSQPCSLAGRP